MTDQVPPQWEQQDPQAETQPMGPLDASQPAAQPAPNRHYGAAAQRADAAQFGESSRQEQVPALEFSRQQPQQQQSQQFDRPPQWARPQEPQPQDALWGQAQPQLQPPQDARAWGGAQWQIPQEPGYGWPPPPAPPKQRWFQRRQTLGIAGAAVLALIGAGVFAFTHSKGDAEVSTVNCAPATLSSCLVARPGSASAMADSWSASVTPTRDDYLNWAFPSDPVAQQTAGDNLSAEGLQGIAHTAWKSTDGNGIDITLLKFSAPQGAHAHALELLGADMTNGDAVSVPLGVPGMGYASAETNNDGDIVTLYSTFVGDIALQVQYTSPQKYSAGDFGAWLSPQYTSLANAPTPAASPQPVSTTQSVACLGSLTSCLLPAPSGTTPWTDTWGTNSSPTAQEYATEMFSSANWRTIIMARLNTSGMTGITHRSWITSNGAEADDVLISFGSANGALAWYKSDTYSATGTAFTVPNQKNSSGTYNPRPDGNGDIAAQVFAVSGNVAMELFTWSPATFDQSRTVTWASQQLGKIAATLSTQTIAVPAAPTPSASAVSSSPGTCSSAQTCLIDAPRGSLPWSGADYDKTTTATVQQYVEENYATADQSYEENLLNNAGVTAIAHREWDAADGTSAILTVLQYGSAKQAQSESLSYQGATLASGTELDVPGLANAAVDVKAMDSDGNIPVKVDVQKGSYEVRLSFYNPATAAPQAAVDIALRQLSQLPAS